MSGNGNFFSLFAGKSIAAGETLSVSLDIRTVYSNLRLAFGVLFPTLGTGALTLKVRNGYGNSDPASTAGALPYVANTAGGSTVPTYVTAGDSVSLTAALSTPVAPVLSTHGTAGVISYSYLIVAKNDDGTLSAKSPVATIATGNATLDMTNYNILTITPVTGATSYDIYRTASAGTPATTGKIGNTASTTFNDQGAAGDGSTAGSASKVWTDFLLKTNAALDERPGWVKLDFHNTDANPCTLDIIGDMA